MWAGRGGDNWKGGWVVWDGMDWVGEGVLMGGLGI